MTFVDMSKLSYLARSVTTESKLNANNKRINLRPNTMIIEEEDANSSDNEDG